MSITNTKNGSNSNSSKSKESGTDIATASKIPKSSKGNDHLKIISNLQIIESAEFKISNK